MIIKGRYLEGGILDPIEIDDSNIEYVGVTSYTGGDRYINFLMKDRGHYYSFFTFHISGIPTAVVDTDTMDYIEEEIKQWRKGER